MLIYIYQFNNTGYDQIAYYLLKHSSNLLEYFCKSHNNIHRRKELIYVFNNSALGCLKAENNVLVWVINRQNPVTVSKSESEENIYARNEFLYKICAVNEGFSVHRI